MVVTVAGSAYAAKHPIDSNGAPTGSNAIAFLQPHCLRLAFF